MIKLFGVTVDDFGRGWFGDVHGFMFAEAAVLASQHAELEYDSLQSDGPIVLAPTCS